MLAGDDGRPDSDGRQILKSHQLICAGFALSDYP
jgi:hypothetical protein